ncbi:MAG: TIGR02594 family protein [Phenylobacterium sp.]|uniref:TIGR02594 family protein n=1 Tax=Phenylobacterium sp. TaxID=1871053 RepID=UPI0025FA17AC|nr:TIGR02594 family protein [Phenylobacterium sp.]MCA3711033.1 TIGR02594 family protein [Phenylobacterium sp.]MCA3722445.1 TIGR02594 family protein [Phenylobacterium sp.]MCA3727039.1 TIGR02594 family protein [Phenylobacterium sp.]MCA6241074.1 TIGR02594 family protein [Phenylobacterium sp.]MCA6260807.1 TIGR02594 family protein [Phenylobacterium sp.]
MTLPKTYAWLRRMTPLPRMVSAALAELGVREAAGAANTTQILRWAVETGLNADYRADSIPWCGLFMAHVARISGREPPPAPPWALSWARFGIEGGQPELGDVLVFMRQGGGHVGLYIGEDSRCYHVLGGNQGDRVCITRIAKERLYAVRQPPYVNKPCSAATYRLAATGEVSSNEA